MDCNNILTIQETCTTYLKWYVKKLKGTYNNDMKQKWNTWFKGSHMSCWNLLTINDSIIITKIDYDNYM